MFNFFKKKIVTENQDDFSLNKLQELTFSAHKKYVADTTKILINNVKWAIKTSANDGLYQFSTMTAYEDKFKDFFQSISAEERMEFLKVLQNTFKEVNIIISGNHSYWIDFDWSGRE